MKIKYFLRGFGTGILFATIILTISYTFSDKNIEEEEDTTPITWETDIQETTEVEETQETTTVIATTEETTEQPKTTSSAYSLVISSGMSSTGVANKLKELGVIQDAKEFDQYLTTQGYSRKILVGTYEIDSTASYEDIAKIITRSR